MKGLRLFLVGFYLLGALVSTRPVRAAGVYVVTSTADTDGGLCGFGGGCTLRAAMTAANLTASPGVETLITFNIPGPGPHTINLASRLPRITGSYITIDGTTEPDYAGTPVIELDGTLAREVTPFSAAGIWIDGDHNTIRGLVINDFTEGIVLSGPLNLVEGNFIGTDVTGTVAEPNGIGIEVQQTANNSRIGQADSTSVTGGGVCDSRCNLISGNQRDGVNIGIADLTTIVGNLIGTDITGTAALPNQVGVRVVSDIAFLNGNVISGNLQEGVLVDSFSDTIVEFNYIGTNTFGTAALPNLLGVKIRGEHPLRDSGFNRVSHNLISGNTNGGVLIENSHDDIVWDNKIGANAAGTAPMPPEQRPFRVDQPQLVSRFLTRRLLRLAVMTGGKVTSSGVTSLGSS